MSYNNLPDNCQDNNPDYPWNQVDEPTCPECDAPLIVNCSDKYCTDIECSECDYSFYMDNFDDYL